jgi:hypothetical protein
MKKFRVQIDKTEYYTYITEVEAESQEEALKIAGTLEKEEPIDSRKNTYQGADVDYVITEKTNKVEQNKTTRVRLTKLEDNAFDGLHPNGIDVGYTREGKLTNKPTIGERLYIGLGFSTSPLTTLPDENGIFKTTYSTYKIEYLE